MGDSFLTNPGDPQTDHALHELGGEALESAAFEQEVQRFRTHLFETVSSVLGYPGAPDALDSEMLALIEATVAYKREQRDEVMRVHHAGHRKFTLEEYRDSISIDRAKGLEVIELPVYTDEAEPGSADQKKIDHLRAYVRFQREDGTWGIREWQWFPNDEHMQDGAYHGDVIAEAPEAYAEYVRQILGAVVIDIRSGENDPLFLIKLGRCMMMVRGYDWDPFGV